MTTELIELVFESTPRQFLNKLASRLFSQFDVSEIYSGDVSIDFQKSVAFDYLRSIDASQSESASIFVKVSSVDLGGVTIERPLIQIISYGGLIDVVVVFSFYNVKIEGGDDPFVSIGRGASEIADENDVGDVYCGLEPAQDDATRFFTKDNVGPLLSSWFSKDRRVGFMPTA
jgi:hypothetical protein